MKATPYISFDGNCAQAIALYEKAFQAKSQIMYYKDAPPDNGYDAADGTENLVMHAQITLGGGAIYLCDMPPQSPVTAGDNIAIMIDFDDMAAAKAAFAALRDGGEVAMELQETFWSKCFGSLTDKFGIIWQFSFEG